MSNRPAHNTDDWVSANFLAYHDAGSGGTAGFSGHEAAFSAYPVYSANFTKRLRQRDVRASRAIGELI